MDGGTLVTQGIHFIDLLQYLLGDVESVRAHIATQLVNVEVEDTAVATLKFKSGALGAKLTGGGGGGATHVCGGAGSPTQPWADWPYPYWGP